MFQTTSRKSQSKQLQKYCKRQANRSSLNKSGISSRSLSKLQSPQIKIYNRNVFLRQAYRNMIQQNHQQQLKQLANCQKLHQSSYKILKQKIENNINQALENVCKQNDQNHIQLITFDQMCEIIFITNQYLRKVQRSLEVEQFLSQIWLYLKNYDIQDEHLDSFTFATFMKILLDPKTTKPSQIKQILSQIQGFKNSNQLKKEFITKFPDLQDEALEDIEIFKLWFTIRQKYNLFLKHPQSSRANKHYNQMTFRPQISQMSRVYAQKSLKKYLSSNKLQHSRRINHQSTNQQENQLQQYLSHKIMPNVTSQDRNTFSYHDLLYERKLQKQTISRKLDFDSEQIKNQFNSRKATPQQIKEIVDKVYYVPEKREDIDQQAIKQQEQLRKCTFHPATTSYDYGRKGDAPVSGFQKQVNRLKKGREQKQKLKQIYQNLGKPKNKKTHGRTPSFIERDLPRLILQVNIGGGKIQKIKLHGNQDARIVAKKFINKHNLQNSMQSVLQDLIDENLRSL